MSNGLFIVIEGPDGVGKTKQAAMLADALTARGRDVVLTAEPTKGEIGQRIRRHLSGEERLANPFSLQTAFALDRLEHCSLVIEPVLNEGGIVICDRYRLSSIAYAPIGNDKVDSNTMRFWARDINDCAICPDICLVLGLSEADQLERLGMRAGADMFDRSFAVQMVAREVYDLPYRWEDEAYVVGANGTPEEVHARILAAVDEIL